MIVINVNSIDIDILHVFAPYRCSHEKASETNVLKILTKS